MSLNRISYRNCKLYLLPGVKCIRLRREHKDFGELMMMGGGGRWGSRGSTVKKRRWSQVMEPVEVGQVIAWRSVHLTR